MVIWPKALVAPLIPERVNRRSGVRYTAPTVRSSPSVNHLSNTVLTPPPTWLLVVLVVPSTETPAEVKNGRRDTDASDSLDESAELTCTFISNCLSHIQ